MRIPFLRDREGGNMGSEEKQRNAYFVNLAPGDIEISFKRGGRMVGF